MAGGVMFSSEALFRAAADSLEAAARDTRAAVRAYDTGHLDVMARLASDAADRASEAAELLTVQASTFAGAPRLVPVIGVGGALQWEPAGGEVQEVTAEVSTRIDALVAW